MAFLMSLPRTGVLNSQLTRPHIQLLRDWRVHHRLTSVAFPHGNCRAEIAVKTVKRITAGNVGSDGDVDVDAVQRAILQYRNSPDPATKQSPATHASSATQPGISSPSSQENTTLILHGRITYHRERQPYARDTAWPKSVGRSTRDSFPRSKSETGCAYKTRQ